MRSFLLAAIALGLGTGAAAQDKPKAEDDAAPISIETVKLDRPADWKIDVHPILKTACLACHNTKDREGDLVLETPADMIKGGESGPAIVPGKGADSLLVKSAARLKKPHMPPKKNKVEAKPLTPRELGLLKLWIDQGAKGTITPTLDAPVWQPTAPSWNPIYAAALDAEGQTVACGRAGRLYFYSVATGRVIAQPSDPKLNGFAHRDAVQAIAFSPDGATLATGGYRSIKIWKKESMETRIALDQTGEVKLATLSADGKKLAVATAEPFVITVYDLATGKASPEMKGHAEAVTSLRFSPDGASLASGSSDKTARIWTIADGKETAKFAAPAAVNAVEWTVNGKQIAIAAADPLLRLWNKGEPAAAKELKGHAAAVTAVALTPAGLLSASQDGKAILWNLETGAQAKTVTHGAPVTAIAASADGKRWLTLGGPSAKLWNAETAAAVATLATDGPAKRRDRESAQLLQFATNELTFRTNAVKTAETHKKAEEDEIKKATDAVPPVEKDVKDKSEAFTKAKSTRETAEKGLAAANAA
ncbi:MAG TPA: c-type cytochrome domain-containing protein, partial [Planctomycetota bacterium]|nr:c-type cytochrome domain-containing protein [Planctomycetota bacterium]